MERISQADGGVNLVSGVTLRRRPVREKPERPIYLWRDEILKKREKPLHPIEPLTKLVCLTIANLLSEVGKTWRISQAEIAEGSGLSEAAVGRHVRKAEAAGLLAVEWNYDRSGHRTKSSYTALIPEPRHDETCPDLPDVGEGRLDANLPDAASGSTPPLHDAASPRLPNAASEQVSSQDLSSHSFSSHPPNPPTRRRRRVGGSRERGENFHQFLDEIAQRPGLSDVVEQLLRPIASARTFEAPDPARRLLELAEYGSQFSGPVLGAALHSVLELRKVTVREPHITDALRKAEFAAGGKPPLDQPGARRIEPDSFITITMESDPEAFAAWLRHEQEKRGRREPNSAYLMEQHGFTRVPTRLPPQATAALVSKNH